MDTTATTVVFCQTIINLYSTITLLKLNIPRFVSNIERIVADLVMLKVNAKVLKNHIKDIEGRDDRVLPMIYEDEDELTEDEIIQISRH